MRKFTKEIAALIASVSLGTVAGLGALSASSDEIVETAGVAMIPDETICTTELPPLGGVPLPSDEWVEQPTEEEIPPLMGDIAPTEWVEPTTEEFPPLAGEPMLPDEWIETTTEEEVPPLMGFMAPADADGDANGDGSFDVADVLTLQKWLLNDPDVKLDNWWAADFYADGKLDVFDLCLMKQALIEKRHEVASDFYFSVTGYSDELLKLDCDDNLDVVITSTSELSDYIEQVYPEDKEQMLDSIKSKFNEDFFENNVLLLKPIYLPSTGYNYSIDNVSYNKNKLIIDYTCKLDGFGCDVVGGLHGVVIIPKEKYHADSVEWRLTTIDPWGIKSGYIAVFNGEDGDTIHQTYVYKINNGAANYGFAYINADFNAKNWSKKVKGEGSVRWTDGVFPVAEANNAYDYVTIPGDETKYTIDEFRARFLMD